MSVRSSEDKFTAETVNNPYLLCDNKWHRIEASVIKNVVSVVVDDLETAYGSSGGSQRFSETNSQLFLGGFPCKYLIMSPKQIPPNDVGGHTVYTLFLWPTCCLPFFSKNI